MSEDLGIGTYTFVWSIENFSLCFQSHSELIVSPVFLVEILEGAKFYLSLYRGNSEDDVHCDFNRAKDDGPEIVYFKVILSICADNKLKLFRTNEKCKAKNGQTLFGKLHENRKYLLKNSEIYLPNDILTLHCCLIPNYSPNKSSKKCLANTVIKLERHTFVVPWISGSFVTSTSLNVSSQDCFFNVPISFQSEHGKFEFQISWPLNLKKKGKVVIRIKSDGDKTYDEDSTDEKATDRRKLLMVFKVYPEEISAIHRCIVFEEQMLLPEEDEWVILFSADEPSPGFFPNGEFFPVRLDFEVSDGTYATTSVKTVHDSWEVFREPNSRSENEYTTIWKALLSDKKFSDVILRVENTDFPAHKCVLSSSSPVFGAMLENDMKEKETGVVEMSDITKETLQQLLFFIYAGRVDDLQQKSAVELYVVGDKYHIPGLKHVCSSYLKAQLTVENVCDILEIADLYQDQDLERKARSYIRCHSKDVFASKEWKSFMEKRLQLSADIMFDCCKIFWN